MDANEFANKWIEVWNSHNLDEILKHYSNDVEITTPMIRIATGIETDSLKGKESVKAYWARALDKIPDLHFELIGVTKGVDSVALYYKSIMNKTAIEVMFFDKQGLVNKMIAHYS